MLVPFVVPQALVVAAVIFPVRLHGRKEVICAKGLQDGGDVGVVS